MSDGGIPDNLGTGYVGINGNVDVGGLWYTCKCSVFPCLLYA